MKTEKLRELVVTSFEEYCILTKQTFLLTYMSDKEKPKARVAFKPNEDDAIMAFDEAKEQIQTLQKLYLDEATDEEMKAILSKEDIKLIEKMDEYGQVYNKSYFTKLMRERLVNIQNYYLYYMENFKNTGMIFYYKNKPYVYPYKMGDFFIRDLVKQNGNLENRREEFFLLNRLLDMRFTFTIGIEKVCEAYFTDMSLQEIIGDCHKQGIDDLRFAHDIKLLTYHLSMGEMIKLLHD